MARAGGIEPLVALARSGTDLQKFRAAGALRKLALNADNKAAIAAAEAALDKERDDEPVVVGERTREQRDAEGRKHAIDLDEETPRKRAKQLEEVHTRIAKGRSVCTSAIDGRYRELLQPAMEAFASHEIDAAELEKRRAAARASRPRRGTARSAS